MATRRSPETPSEGYFPLAAQIPLQSFVFPIFPPQASRLRELTLTCDIKLDEYQEILKKHSLEEQRKGSYLRIRMSVGRHTLQAIVWSSMHRTYLQHYKHRTRIVYPGISCWLAEECCKESAEAEKLDLLSCLIDGLDEGSRNDAMSMLEMLKLRDLHVIDSFTRPGFWREAAIGLSEEHERAKEAHTEDEEGQYLPPGQRLQVLEMSYTYRGHSDPEFMSRIAGEELPELLGSGLVAASFNLLAPPRPPPQDDGVESNLLEDPANLDEKGELIDRNGQKGSYHSQNMDVPPPL